MEYDEFLEARRQKISTVIRDAFALISGGEAQLPTERVVVEDTALAEVPLSELLAAGILKPGDLLDPVDPDWQVDAVISEDGTIIIDGLHEFDTLDDAAGYLEVTNISGFEFWALERDGGVAPLTEVVAEHAGWIRLAS